MHRMIATVAIVVAGTCNTALGNIKSAISATFRSVNKKHAPRRLAEFEYRFNRRYDLPAMIHLGWARCAHRRRPTAC